jgi:hypothetical protein
MPSAPLVLRSSKSDQNYRITLLALIGLQIANCGIFSFHDLVNQLFIILSLSLSLNTQMIHNSTSGNKSSLKDIYCTLVFITTLFPYPIGRSNPNAH